MSNNISQVAKFYDDYTKKKNKVDKNLRHYIIINQLIKRGLKPNSNILEVGCSNGALSELICSKNSSGNFLGLDISPKSIEIAKNRLSKYKNAKFMVSDMSELKSDINFDIVVFPDVLEHIPQENHKSVFNNIVKVCKNDSEIFVNIPSPEFNNYLRREEPDKLQIIDQELNLGQLISTIESVGFIIDSFQRHSIFRNENDYVMIWFRRNKIKDFSKPKSNISKFLQKLLLKIKNL